MNAYLLAKTGLGAALLLQALACGLALEHAVRPGTRERGVWIALGLAGALTALHHGYLLELASRTGIYDLRQAALLTLAGLGSAWAVWRLTRPA